MTDLTFLEDGNPDMVKSKIGDHEIINFDKRQMVLKVLQEILLNQQTPYRIPALEPLKTMLTELPFESEKDLYNLSLLHEPRNADPKTIM